MKSVLTLFDQTRFYKWCCKTCNKSSVVKTLATLAVWIIALVPVYLYMFLRWGMSPRGFWEELALFIVAALIIGWLQMIFILFAVILTVKITTEDL